jgi:hypothetical protein
MDPRNQPIPATGDSERIPDPKSEAVDEIVSSVIAILEDAPREPRKGKGRGWRGLGWWKS